MSTKFSDLQLHPFILKALDDEGYVEPTPIQALAIPSILEGKDVLGTAQTGTGKTAAFSLPTLQMLSERCPQGNRFIRALVLTPTRELALQVQDSFRTYGRHLKLSTECVMGGVPMGAQIKRLRTRPDILVATPGRLLDLIRQKVVRLDKVETLILDEADRMLDMGFVKDVRSIVATTPRKRQTLLFSATLSRDIAELSADMLNDPVRVEVARSATVSGAVDQQVMFVNQSDKGALLTNVLRSTDFNRALVFTRTKHRANRLSVQLSRNGIKADAIHGNKTQGARQQALNAFHRGHTKVLVATDIVARGIDVEGITHVINFELPNDPESYVHRIGRTARAGASGVALSFCAREEVDLLREIEKLTRTPLRCQDDHEFHSAAIATLQAAKPQAKSQSHRRPNANNESRNSAPRNGQGRRPRPQKEAETTFKSESRFGRGRRVAK
jgi:ATP-dependent RNA helicase RhlE